jgi:hypothetical protein
MSHINIKYQWELILCRDKGDGDYECKQAGVSWCGGSDFVDL